MDLQNRDKYKIIKSNLGCGYRPEHRVVMENHLGRILRKDEYVHHIDGNSLNNKLSNLMVVSPSEHRRLHPLSREICEKYSKQYKGKKLPAELKARMSESHKGKVHSPEARQKMSESQKGRIISPESRLKMSIAAKGKILSEQTKLKMSEIRKGMHQGSKHPQAKLKNTDIPVIRKKILERIPYPIIAHEFNVSPSTICEINTGKRWAHV